MQAFVSSDGPPRSVFSIPVKLGQTRIVASEKVTRDILKRSVGRMMPQNAGVMRLNVFQLNISMLPQNDDKDNLLSSFPQCLIPSPPPYQLTYSPVYLLIRLIARLTFSRLPSTWTYQSTRVLTHSLASPLFARSTNSNQ